MVEFDNLITSPFGIGERLILELLRRGESVFAVYPTAKDVPMSFLGKKNIKYGFLRFEQDPVLDKTLPRKVKHVFHNFDAYHGRLAKLFKANTLATLLLLDWAKNAGVQTFTYLSSGEVYGSGENIDENAALDPQGPYAVTKYQAEMLLEFYRKAFRINTVRLFFPFGKGVEQGFVSDLARAIKDGERVESPYQQISPTFVEDTIAPLIAVRDQKEAGIHNLCGSPVNVTALVEQIGQAAGKAPAKLKAGNNMLCGSNRQVKERLTYVETPLPDAINITFSE
ncbi:NAD(P)-dependent oxidoreductase [candidate division WOR-3 bacterium]|nr:NAD(P)-dependent oxidoreductase [candidate division WOR-3 bacterium]